MEMQDQDALNALISEEFGEGGGSIQFHYRALPQSARLHLPLCCAVASRDFTTVHHHKKIDLKLGAPHLPDFVMTITGEVTTKNEDRGGVDIEVIGENNVWGMRMQGSVQIQLPKGA